MPAEVLEQAAAEMLNWPDAQGRLSGMGVMEMSHRGKEFLSIYEAAEADLRELLAAYLDQPQGSSLIDSWLSRLTARRSYKRAG